MREALLSARTRTLSTHTSFVRPMRDEKAFSARTLGRFAFSALSCCNGTCSFVQNEKKNATNSYKYLRTYKVAGLIHFADAITFPLLKFKTGLLKIP